jgi:hypothetical protein
MPSSSSSGLRLHAAAGGVMLACYSLLPLSFQILKYPVVSLLLVGLVLFGRELLLFIRQSRLGWVVPLLLLVYAYGLFVAAVKSNPMDLAFQDAAGFPLYLMFPVAGMYLRHWPLVWIRRLVLLIAQVIAVIHLLAYVVFHLIAGELNFTTMIAANLWMKSVGFTAEFAASNGLLRINFGIGPLLVYGLLVCVHDVLFMSSRSEPGDYRRLIMAAWGLAFGLAIFVEGHRSLIVTAILGLIMMATVARWRFVLDLRSMALALLVSIVGVAGLTAMAQSSGALDLAAAAERLVSLVDFGSGKLAGDDEREEQFSALLDKIDDAPFLGHGFGSSARVIRSDTRPFMYELDLLAVWMKLGAVCAIGYLALTVIPAIRTSVSIFRGQADPVLAPVCGFSMALLFHMSSNGGYAMSPFSTLSHIIVFLLLERGLEEVASRPPLAGAAPARVLSGVPE